MNYATGVAEPESKEELSHQLALSARILTRLVLQTVETLKEEDLAYDHGFLYRVEGGFERDGSPRAGTGRQRG